MREEVAHCVGWVACVFGIIHTMREEMAHGVGWVACLWGLVVWCG